MRKAAEALLRVMTSRSGSSGRRPSCAFSQMIGVSRNNTKRGQPRFRLRFCQATSVISQPIPAGSPMVSAKGNQWLRQHGGYCWPDSIIAPAPKLLPDSGQPASEQRCWNISSRNLRLAGESAVVSRLSRTRRRLQCVAAGRFRIRCELADFHLGQQSHEEQETDPASCAGPAGGQRRSRSARAKGSPAEQSWKRPRSISASALARLDDIGSGTPRYDEGNGVESAVDADILLLAGFGLGLKDILLTDQQLGGGHSGHAHLSPQVRSARRRAFSASGLTPDFSSRLANWSAVAPALRAQIRAKALSTSASPISKLKRLPARISSLSSMSSLDDVLPGFRPCRRRDPSSAVRCSIS